MEKSTTCGGDPSARATTMNPPPPIPFIHGSTTPVAEPLATAASTALPPDARMPAPTAAASRLWAATTPRGDMTTDFLGGNGAGSGIRMVHSLALGAVHGN